jgi:hypothetical protein
VAGDFVVQVRVKGLLLGPARNDQGSWWAGLRLTDGAATNVVIRIRSLSGGDEGKTISDSLFYGGFVGKRWDGGMSRLAGPREAEHALYLRLHCRKGRCHTECSEDGVKWDAVSSKSPRDHSPLDPKRRWKVGITAGVTEGQAARINFDQFKITPLRGDEAGKR